MKDKTEGTGIVQNLDEGVRRQKAKNGQRLKSDRDIYAKVGRQRQQRNIDKENETHRCMSRETERIVESRWKEIGRMTEAQMEMYDDMRSFLAKPGKSIFVI